MNELSAHKLIPWPKLQQVCQGTLLLIAMSATTSGYTQTSPATSMGEAMGQLGSTFGNIFKQVSPSPGTALLAPNQSTSAPQVSSVSGNPVIGIPISADYRMLFQKGTVTGQDLYETLKAMRLELHAKRSALAWSQLSLALNQGLNLQPSSSGLDVSGLLQTALMTFAMETMKNVTANVAMQTLDEYLQYLLNERRSALAEESITLPSIQGMTDIQAKRAITMATLIVTARLSHKILEKADQDFKSLEVDYKSLLTQRETAANLLFATIDQRRIAQRANNADQKDVAESDLKKSLTEKDLAFIDTALNTIALSDFAKNMAAQNLAVKYLQSKDPTAFKDYRTKADDVVRKTTAYMRTVAGVAAFGGLTISFGHSIAEVARENNLSSVLSSFPLGVEFMKAAAPLVKKSVEVSLAGIAIPMSNSVFDTFFRKPFIYSFAGQATKQGSASDVFKFIQESKLSDTFVGALFLNNTSGWLSRVRLCDPVETGRMMDAVVSQDERTKFATNYFGWSQETGKAKDFSFINAIPEPGASRQERRLSEELLGKDHRNSNGDADSQSLATVQRAVEAKYSKWSDQDLLRLVFHNREDEVVYATLDLGAVSIRPVPSAESVYAYESRFEACRKMSDRELAADVPAVSPATRPAPAGVTVPPKKAAIQKPVAKPGTPVAR